MWLRAGCASWANGLGVAVSVGTVASETLVLGSFYVLVGLSSVVIFRATRC